MTNYVGILPAKVLINPEISKVDWWTPDQTDGYQRPLVSKRISEISWYLIKEEGVFPTSILLSIRSPKVKFDESKGILNIPEGEPLWLIDGQHRIAGLKRAIEQGEHGLEDYDLPVTIMVNPDRFDEMRHFYLVNNRVKSVPTDIVDRLLQRMLAEKGELWVSERESPEAGKADKAVRQGRATNIVDYIRNNCLVWKDMISVPSEAKPSRYAIKQHTMVSALLNGPLKNPSLIGLPDDQIGQLLDRYWCAVKQVFPEAINDPAKYSILITPGIFSLHAIFPDVFDRCREVRDYSQKKMTEILNGMGVDSDFWSKDPKNLKVEPLTFGGSMKSLSLLAAKLRRELPKLTLAI